LTVGRSPRERRGGLGADRPTSDERFGWLRAQLVVSRALDGALWRYFHLRESARTGRTDGDDLAGIHADFETVRKHRGELCPGLGSPVPLIRDIREKADGLMDNRNGAVTNAQGPRARSSAANFPRLSATSLASRSRRIRTSAV